VSEAVDPLMRLTEIFLVSDGFRFFKEYNRREAVELFIDVIKDPKIRHIAYTLLYSSSLGFVYRVAKELLARRRIPSSFRTFLVLKIVSSDEDEIIRETILHRASLKRIFSMLHLPTRRFNGMEITNRKWRILVDILDGRHDAMWRIKRGDIETLMELRIPAHRALQFVCSERRAEYFRMLAEKWPEEFLRHMSLARRYLPREEIGELRKKTLEKAKISSELVSMSKIEHLGDKEVISKEESYEKLRQEFEKLLSEVSELGYTIIILIDASGSMSVTTDFINEIRPILMIGGIAIEFRNVARDITRMIKSGEYVYYSDGSTSITAAYLLALEKLAETDKKAIFILISDMGHNTAADPQEYVWEKIAKNIRILDEEDKNKLCMDIWELLKRIRTHGHFLILIPLGYIHSLGRCRRVFNVVLRKHDEATRETIRDIYLGIKQTIRLIEIRKKELEKIRRIRESLVPFRVERGTIERVLIHNAEPPEPKIRLTQ